MIKLRLWAFMGVITRGAIVIIKYQGCIHQDEPEVGFVRFPDFRVLLFFLLVPGERCALWKKLPCGSHTSSGVLHSPFLRAEYLCKLFGLLCMRSLIITFSFFLVLFSDLYFSVLEVKCLYLGKY